MDTSSPKNSLEDKYAVPILIKNKSLQRLIVTSALLSLGIMILLAISSAVTPNWVASILLLPFVVLAFTGMVRKVIWSIPLSIILLLSFWPLAIVYLIQKNNQQNQNIKNSLLFSFFPWIWSLFAEWGIIVFGSLIILLGLFVSSK